MARAVVPLRLPLSSEKNILAPRVQLLKKAHGYFTQSVKRPNAIVMTVHVHKVKSVTLTPEAAYTTRL